MEASKEPVTSCIPSEKNSLLIGEVRKFPSLYDTSDPNYYVLAERNKAWLVVANNCHETAELCHLRWKSLRKRFAKEKRKIPDILQGRRRPWALFPKMSFLTPSTPNSRIKPVKSRRKSEPVSLGSKSDPDPKQLGSEDDMLIVDDNDEIVHTCKSMEASEDEYIYETLDDPDSALEIMKNKPIPTGKPMAIRTGISPRATTAAPPISSKRIRRLTPKMQNSIIAKKLKQAQQILQQSDITNHKLNKKSSTGPNVAAESKKIPVTPRNNPVPDKAVLYQDKTTRHVATVNPNIIRVERIMDNSTETLLRTNHKTPTKRDSETVASEENRPFKVVKLKGRNPIIFSPDQLPNIQSFLKSESVSPTKEPSEPKPPTIKVKTVDNLNSQNTSPVANGVGETSNLDIIHSVGLVRRDNMDKSTATEKTSHQSYSRAYSWNRPAGKTSNKQTETEKLQPDSQTKEYEIEETWNDIKEENIDDTASWSNPADWETQRPHEGMMHITSLADTPAAKVNMWNKLNEAKLELVAYQRRLLEEQHKKNLEYMKKEHDLKMTLLKAEIDLKRKQLNIML